MTEILLIGDGTLADAIADVVAGVKTCAVTRADHAATAVAGTVVVVASDAGDVTPYAKTRAVCAERGAIWLPVRTELGQVMIGPSERPGGTGCHDCAESRRWRSRVHPREHDAVLDQNRDELRTRRSAWLTGLAADVVATLVADEAAALSQPPARPDERAPLSRASARADEGNTLSQTQAVADEGVALSRAPARARTDGGFLRVRLDELDVSRHAFLPDPLCPSCGDLLDDAATPLTLEAHRKEDPGAYRVRALAGEVDALADTYVDEEAGLIRLLSKSSDAGSVVAAAWMGLRDGATEGGFGRTRSYRSSRLVAILEALERHGGMQPGGKRTTVRASRAELGERALDPRLLGLFPDERHELDGFRYQRYDDDGPYTWVWGYSFARDAPILVPESYAYYRVRSPGRFVYEISNGCALGGSMTEAIMYGILEVAERDAFLMTWYARMAVPRIQLDQARDPTIPLIAEALTARTGYRIHVFDTTLEQGIPCVWAMAVNPSDTDGRPKVACAAGSHLDPEKAVENALSELATTLPDVIGRYPGLRDAARRMVDDPSLVKDMAHHSLLYGTPEAFSRFAFLLGDGNGDSDGDGDGDGDSDGNGDSDGDGDGDGDSDGNGDGDGDGDSDDRDRAQERRAPSRGAAGRFRNADLREDLDELVRAYLDEGLDVVVVDQTTPEHRAGGFSCVKVIIPGTLAMTFGHDMRRVDGLPRLLSVPHTLGYAARPLRPGDLNPHPHPFP
ncbi:TOMM precursor leader peptide-binding protein [Nonomuraea sp. K274]|uniref:TOMM leader peptide-binding protein n=1 Tax=Nonomuraea cypriaca TaxID=1187855 RepID=A0A931AG58_9ACTN|nr:TOMM precursor leader peptide-binding protein [Nonomuraea cypriaca]MBF8191025.1 TOMM precursor leader peptide-binding protein [Nonomuraea cypriaca]